MRQWKTELTSKIADPVSRLREIANRYQGTSRCGSERAIATPHGDRLARMDHGHNTFHHSHPHGSHGRLLYRDRCAHSILVRVAAGVRQRRRATGQEGSVVLGAATGAYRATLRDFARCSG